MHGGRRVGAYTRHVGGWRRGMRYNASIDQGVPTLFQQEKK
jgi:hypothetical protein